MWKQLNAQEDLKQLKNNSYLRRLPNEDDHINEPVEFVVVQNSPNEGIISLSIPVYLNDYFKKWYGLNTLFPAMNKDYNSFGEAKWEYKI